MQSARAGAPISCPPRSKVRNLILAIESSSDAASKGSRARERSGSGNARRALKPRQWWQELRRCRRRTWVLRGVVLRQALVLQHVQ